MKTEQATLRACFIFTITFLMDCMILWATWRCTIHLNWPSVPSLRFIDVLWIVLSVKAIRGIVIR